MSKIINIVKNNKILRRTIAILLILCVLLVCVREFFKFYPWLKPLVYDKEKFVVVDDSIGHSTEQNKDYWISTHYFADGWAVNFWDSEFDNIDSDFTQIADDGFNSIIIVVPWREFQPDIESGDINKDAIDKLSFIFDKANQHNLGVIMRVGYTYDVYNGESSEALYDRYYGLLNKKSYRNQWLKYCESIYDVAQSYENYYGAFLTWEDFWLACSRAKEVCGNNELSNDFSMQIGYSRYMHDTYSAENIGEIFGEKFAEDDVVYVPDVESTAFKTFYDFYDYKLMEVLEDTQEVFPNISLEVRWDDDYYAGTTPYTHDKTYGVADAGYATVMYGIPMGMINNGEKVSWKKALRKTYQIMKVGAERSWPKKYFIDQFLYYDNTQGMENNAQIREEDIPDYITHSYKVLLKYTRGYGLWAYKDLRYDGVVNGEFAKGLESWSTSSDSVIIEEHDDSKMCIVPAGESIEQDLTGRVGTESKKMSVELDVELVNKSAEVTISIGGIEKSIVANKSGHFILNLKNADFNQLKISTDADIRVDNIRVYNNVQTNYMYDLSGNKQSAVNAVRYLNQKLIKTIK